MAERKFLDLEGLSQYDAAIKEVIADGDSAIESALTSGTTVVAEATHAVSADTATTASSASSVAWANVTGKPSTYAPTSHTHAITDVTDLETTLDTMNEDIDGSISGLSISGKVITYTKNDGTTGTITTQDTNTDTKVTQTVTTADAEYTLLASNTANRTSTGTEAARFAAGVTLNPADKSITATTFIGALSGNATSATTATSASSATKATQDASGNVITSTYATKTELDTAKSALQTSINGKANSSHTHTIANITNLQTTLDGKAASSHNHAASNITSGTLFSDRLPTVPIAKGGTGATTAAAALTNLGITATAAELNKMDGVTVTSTELGYLDGVTSNVQTQLDALSGAIDGKADTSHTHAISNVTNLQSTLDSKVPTSRTINGKALSANITLSASDVGASASSHNHDGRYYTETEIDTKLADKANSSHTHSITNITNLQTTLDGKSNTSHSHSTHTQANMSNTDLNTIKTAGWYYGYTGMTNAPTQTIAVMEVLVYSPDWIVQRFIVVNGAEYIRHWHSGTTWSEWKTNVDSGNISSQSVASATKATQDGNGKVISSTYETKTDASAKLTEAKTYADNAANTVKNDLLNNAGGAYDTLKELGDLIDDNKDAIDALETVAAGKANAVHTHAISDVTNLQSTLDGKANSSHSHDDYMTTTNPVGTGSFSMNRKSNSTVGSYSHAEGYNTTASGSYSHAEGYDATASGDFSHAEGYNTNASGDYSHAEGNDTSASGYSSHAEGYDATASGDYSHAEGDSTNASGDYSHAEGNNTTALAYQHAQGHYNDTSKATAYTGSGTSTGTAFVIGNGTSSTASNAFRVNGLGQVMGKAAYSASGADYAELFEWADQNLDNEDRVGYFVTFDNNRYICKAKEGDYILGIVSGNPCVLGNHDECWLGQYEMDEWGRFVYEDVEEVDEETGETKKYSFYKVNPDYDKDREYTHRQDRAEWDAIGLMGVLSVRDDGTCEVNGYCKCTDEGIATAAERGLDTYRVIERVNENIVKVVLK